MPELPEVETVKVGLQRLLVAKKFKTVEFDWPKSFPNPPQTVNQFLIGASVVAVQRRAKVLLIELSSHYTLVTHLKMTGQLVYRSQSVRFGAGHPSDSLIGQLPDRSTRVRLEFSDGSKLYFNDQRKFGWMRIVPTAEVAQLDFFKKLGPEPLLDTFGWPDLKLRLLRRKNTNIKAALLDQTVIAGVGNIYADESLWGAKIHPLQLVRDLPDTKIKRLHQSLRAILELSISKGGSTDRNYVDAEGRPGNYLDFASVFRKQGQPCRRCKTIIIKTRVASRGTHLCPKCQRLFN